MSEESYTKGKKHHLQDNDFSNFLNMSINCYTVIHVKFQELFSCKFKNPGTIAFMPFYGSCKNQYPVNSAINDKV